MYQLVFNIDAVAKGRPRFTRQGRAYTPKKTAEFENALKEMAMSQYKEQMLLGALSARIVIYISRPKSVSEKKRPHPIVKPDLDNLAKSILDPLNGIVYKDDSQIVELALSKKYAEKGMIVVSLYDYGA